MYQIYLIDLKKQTGFYLCSLLVMYMRNWGIFFRQRIEIYNLFVILYVRSVFSV